MNLPLKITENEKNQLDEETEHWMALSILE